MIMITPTNTYYQNAIAAKRNLTTIGNILWKTDSYNN